MSNLIKSGFVAFSQNDKLVINANENKIIKAIDSIAEETSFEHTATVEEVLAEALIMDAELDGTDFGSDNLLTMDKEQLESLTQSKEEMQQVADEIIQTAQAEADEIVGKAHDEAEKLRGQAYDEADQIKVAAKEEGYRAGYEEAMEVANREIAEKETLLEQQKIEMEQMFQEKERVLLNETEHRMVELLCQLIPSITGVVVENQKDVLLYMINAAMHDLDNSKHFVIKVSQADYDELMERKAEIYGALNPAIHMEIFEDAKLSPMQCLIETDNGIVDVSLDVQLDNLITALKLMMVE
ncbi:MAG: hypothetical protein IJP29_01195 [Lachnospiraceae bacterium]|nr:hypothetical protein [Lachnospiraceae bacterium]